jgi:AcrR family transcriptional regulator
MATQNEADGPRNQIQSKQQERAQRILDAAAELILRWGYDKTTVDDISQKADVAKGTIYLHWKTREELFEALLRRESMALMEDLKRRIAQDPGGATLRGIYKQTALALINCPLLKAVMLGDREIIGKMAHTEQNQTSYERRLSGFYIYLDFLRSRGLIRSDISFQAQVYAVTAIFSGFFMLAPLVPNEMRLSDEEIAELIGETIHRTFETGSDISAAEMQDLSAGFIAYLDEIQKNSQVYLQQTLQA